MMRRPTLLRRVLAPFLGVGIQRLPGLVFIYRRAYRVLAPRGLHEVRVNGLRMIADFDDIAITPSLWLRRKYEPTSTLAFRCLVTPDSTVLDVGAHIGYYSLLAGSIVNAQGTIVAVEPNPLVRSLLSANVLLNGFRNVRISPLALSDMCGSGTLYADRGATGAGSLERSCVSQPGLEHAVRLGTLDSLCSEEEVIPTLVKVDVQGLEGRVLSGASTVLSSHRPALMIEFNPMQLARSGSRPESVLAMLTELNYALFLVDEELGALRQLGGAEILATCLSERRDGSGFRNVVAVQLMQQQTLRQAGLIAG